MSAPWWAENSKRRTRLGARTWLPCSRTGLSPRVARAGRKVGFPWFQVPTPCHVLHVHDRCDPRRRLAYSPDPAPAWPDSPTESTRDLARRIENWNRPHHAGHDLATSRQVGRVPARPCRNTRPRTRSARFRRGRGPRCERPPCRSNPVPGGEILRVPVPAQLRSIETRKADLQRRNRRRRAPRKGVAPSNRWRKAQTRIDRLDGGPRASASTLSIRPPRPWPALSRRSSWRT